MKDLQQTDSEDATIAKLGDATFTRSAKRGYRGDWTCEQGFWMDTELLIRYGATFWKPIIPEPGYRLVEDHERVGEKPKGCRIFCKDGSWNTSYAVEWANNETYAVPVQQVVAVACGVDYNSEWHMAKFQTPDMRDRAVERANRGEGR